MTVIDRDDLLSYVRHTWADDILPTLQEYIAIPCVSKTFDADWRAHGHLDRAIELIRSWCSTRAVAGLSVEVHELPGLTPVILVDVPAFLPERLAAPADDVVLLYGHCDKQPELTGWREDLGPWKPVIEGTRLYGRGGADDGYAAFASLVAIEAAQRAGIPHTRCVVLIEASEESGSPDLPAYVAHLKDRIGSPSLVLCLDSGCMDHERLWVTTSLRGIVVAKVRVDILTEGVHSGEASGLVPSSFRILRQLLDRIEDPQTGRLLLPEFHAEIPADRAAQAADTAREFTIAEHFPFVDGAQPMTHDPAEQLLARTWRPALSITGMDGIPPTAIAGNVLRPFTTATLSLRLPPTCDVERAVEALRQALTTDVPYGAHVTVEVAGATGWNAPSFSPWLETALADASTAAFGQPHRAFGEGGSIPFMGMLGEQFPEAQFVVTGVLGPGSNAHGPNEFIELPTAENVTATLALVLGAHGAR